MIIFKPVVLYLSLKEHTSMHVHVNTPSNISEGPRTSCASCMSSKLRASDLNKNAKLFPGVKRQVCGIKLRVCFGGRLALMRSWT